MKALILFLFLCPQTLLAKTIFEPSVSLNSGGYSGEVSGTDNLASGTEVQIDYNSAAFGFRYGITRQYIHVTGVVDAFWINQNNDTSSIDGSSQLRMNYGVGFGYEWNIPLRTYVIVGMPISSLELAYFYSEKFLIGLKYNRMDMKFDNGSLTASTVGLTVSMPIEFDYPSYWWRKKDWE